MREPRKAELARLKALEQRYNGLNTKIVLADARKPSSPLHKRIYGVSDRRLADERRSEIAQEMINYYRVIIVTENHGPVTIPEFAYDYSARKHRSTTTMAKSPELREEIWSQIRNDVIAHGINKCHAFGYQFGGAEGKRLIQMGDDLKAVLDRYATRAKLTVVKPATKKKQAAHAAKPTRVTARVKYSR